MKKLILGLLLGFLFQPLLAEAQGSCAEGRDCVPDQQQLNGEPPGVPTGGILPGAKKTEEIRGHVTNELMPRVINFVLVATISACILFIIIGGLMYVFSMGESERINKAKEMILWALIGLAIAVLAFTIVRIVTGIDFIRHQPIPPGSNSPLNTEPGKLINPGALQSSIIEKQ